VGYKYAGAPAWLQIFCIQRSRRRQLQGIEIAGGISNRPAHHAWLAAAHVLTKFSSLD
jgi:hypothetical protein